jgi:hypothetical protein
MIDVDSEDYKILEERCRNHSPAYDPERIIQMANALHLMTVKKRHHKDGSFEHKITCYKSKKTHIKQSPRHRENF